MPDFVLQAGKFNIVPTIIAIGSGVALLGAVSNLFKYSVDVSVDNWSVITEMPLEGDAWSPVTT